MPQDVSIAAGVGTSATAHGAVELCISWPEAYISRRNVLESLLFRILEGYSLQSRQ